LLNKPQIIKAVDSQHICRPSLLRIFWRGAILLWKVTQL